MPYTAIIRYPSVHDRDMANEFYESATIPDVRRKAIEGSASNCPRTLEIIDTDGRTMWFSRRKGHERCEQIRAGHV